VTPICSSKITDALEAFRKVMVEFFVPWNVIELFTAFVCHAFLGKNATISAKNESSMLEAASTMIL